MTTLYHYKIWCTTENDYIFTWMTEPPTTCPNNNGHTVDTNSIILIETVSEQAVTIKQPTDGYFMIEHYEFPIPSGTPGDTVTINHVMDDTVLLWITGFDGTPESVGDKFDVVVNPDTTIGVVTSTVNVTDTVINVNSTVTANAVRGMYITLDDTVNVQNVGKILAIDAGAGTLTVKIPSDYTFAPGTLVKINFYMAKNIVINSLNTHNAGEKGFSGKVIPAGTHLRMFYTNNDGAAKTFVWKFGYYFGTTFTF